MEPNGALDRNHSVGVPVVLALPDAVVVIISMG
jgi:hypothetical protein